MIPNFLSSLGLSFYVELAMQILLADGVPENRVEAVGKGDADPVGDNRTAQGRAQNRRVEIRVEQ